MSFLEFYKQQLMENEKELATLRALARNSNNSDSYLEARIQFLRHQVSKRITKVIIKYYCPLELAGN